MGYYSHPITDPSYETGPNNTIDDSKLVPIPLWVVVTILNGPTDPWWPQALHQIQERLDEFQRQIREQQSSERGWEHDMEDSD